MLSGYSGETEPYDQGVPSAALADPSQAGREDHPARGPGSRDEEVQLALHAVLTETGNQERIRDREIAL